MRRCRVSWLPRRHGCSNRVIEIGPWTSSMSDGRPSPDHSSAIRTRERRRAVRYRSLTERRPAPPRRDRPRSAGEGAGRDRGHGADDGSRRRRQWHAAAAGDRHRRAGGDRHEDGDGEDGVSPGTSRAQASPRPDPTGSCTATRRAQSRSRTPEAARGTISTADIRCGRSRRG
jgi:hypothetical protein